jgi:hypothetical protein
MLNMETLASMDKQRVLKLDISKSATASARLMAVSIKKKQ